MLVALLKLGAPLPLSGTQALTTLRLPLRQAHLPQTRLLTSTSTSSQRPSALTSRPRHFYDGSLPNRSYSDCEMFHQAVQRQSAAAAIPASSNPAYKQPTIATPYSRTGSTQKPAARPTTFGSDNTLKQNAATTQRPSGQSTQGIKRTSGGWEKSLSQEFDDFDYSSLEISEMEKENSFPTYRAPAQGKSDLAAVLFDDNDFDSDIDLEAEDPAIKATVTYPQPSPQNTVDSGYSSRPQSMQPKNNQPKAEPDSSQPIPWSSSPAEHFKTPPKPAAKRRQLPWAHKQSKQGSPEPSGESSNKRQKSTASTTTQASTPASKSLDKSDYMWTTTASAVKQQQKNFREQNKKTNQSTDSDLQDAIRKRKKHSVARIFLSEEQQHVLNLVTEYKKSVFFTGSAGTGKSVLLREIIAGLRRKYIREPDRVAVTASTGLAACNIGGVTLHSFAGIGLGKEPVEDLVKKIRRNAKAKQRWLRTKVLIMDEVSMVDGDLFDKLEQIARTLRNNGRPFGGIQLVITGDFFQLPPVPEFGRQSKFAFDAGTWTTSIEHTIGLHHVFRQKDPVFAGMLNEMREGRMSAESIANFKKLDRPLPPSDDNIEATELFPTRQEVDRANNLRMQQLHGTSFSFEARDGGSVTNKEQRDRLLQSCMVPEVVQLKKGAQVMLVKNLDDSLVNGSLGKVTGFMTEAMFEIYKEDEEAFLEGGTSENAMKAEMAKSTLGLNTAQVFPLVRFAIADGTTRDLLCKREDWKIELPNGEVQASRSQIPLILAWALSIHKAQGQTLERVRVDLGRVFEKGQAYVALSRATSMAGLQILRFDPRKVIAHEKVRSFYSSLSRAEQVQETTKSKTILGKMLAGNAKRAVVD